MRFKVSGTGKTIASHFQQQTSTWQWIRFKRSEVVSHILTPGLLRDWIFQSFFWGRSADDEHMLFDLPELENLGFSGNWDLSRRNRLNLYCVKQNLKKIESQDLFMVPIPGDDCATALDWFDEMLNTRGGSSANCGFIISINTDSLLPNQAPNSSPEQHTEQYTERHLMPATFTHQDLTSPQLTPCPVQHSTKTRPVRERQTSGQRHWKNTVWDVCHLPSSAIAGNEALMSGSASELVPSGSMVEIINDEGKPLRTKNSAVEFEFLLHEVAVWAMKVERDNYVERIIFRRDRQEFIRNNIEDIVPVPPFALC
jgi:hypothetical protein